MISDGWHAVVKRQCMRPYRMLQKRVPCFGVCRLAVARRDEGLVETTSVPYRGRATELFSQPPVKPTRCSPVTRDGFVSRTM